MNKPILKIYRTTNWSSYNRALVNRGNALIWFTPTTQWYAQPKAAMVEIKLILMRLFNATL